MKKLFILTVITNLFFANTQAQNVTGTASPIMQAPLLLSTNSTTNSGTQWNVAVKLEMTKGHGVPNAQTFLQKKICKQARYK